MRAVHFLTHPEVLIDPAVPVPDWGLSPLGLRRSRLAAERRWPDTTRAVFHSGERKARETAQPIAARLGLVPVTLEALGENDRSATGYLPKAEFETVADAFFAHPRESVRGWERALDAQNRIVAAVGSALRLAPAGGDIAIVAHGGVGALLLCHLKGIPITRAEDQPGDGGGNAFRFEAATGRLLSGWRRIEDEL